jgi:inorganic pyrophosphatase
MDKGLPDDKILAVPATDPLSANYRDIADIPPHFLREVAHFFEVYKDLEGERTRPIGWESAQVALEQIMHAINLYRTEFQPPSL